LSPEYDHAAQRLQATPGVHLGLQSNTLGPAPVSQIVETHAMRKARPKNVSQVPPQLIGILADAVAIGATGFRLEPNPPHIMASFAAGSQATEIDFEAWSGREMMDFLAGQVTDPVNRAGQFEVECDAKRYVCRVVLDRTRGAKQAEVTWA
jgi:hypothetical protein